MIILSIKYFLEIDLQPIWQLMRISQISNVNDNSLLLLIGIFIALLLLAVLFIVTLKIHVDQALLKSEQSEHRFERLYNEISTIMQALPVGVEIY